jgi:hypothetical protein
MMFMGLRAAFNSAGRLATFLPVLIALHLGMAHTDHLSPSLRSTLVPGNEAESQHVSVAHHDSEDLAKGCPVPTVVLRADLYDLDPVAIEPVVTPFDVTPAQLPDKLADIPLPQRPDGPSRQALLQCFRL